MPIYEDGHARNVERFATMISFVTSYGVAYNPSNTAITLANLNAKLFAANNTMDDVSNSRQARAAASNARENTFAPLKPLSTRVYNYYAASGAPANSVKDAQTLNKKIQGQRVTPLIEDDPNTPEDESLQNISSSQQSYTQLVEHLDGLIDLLGLDSSYSPNEPDLALSELTTLSTAMKDANTNSMNANTNLSVAFLDRNEAMYEETTGLVDIAATVKKYVKAVFGADSPEFAQISGLQFKKPNKK